MTTGGWPEGQGGRERALTKLPAAGSVLVRSPAPPDVAVDVRVDVRPGTAATFDGDRLRFPFRVTDGEVRQRFGRDELPALEGAIADLLEDADSAAVRFGDRAACRRILPAASLDAVERRLLAATRREGRTLVAWTAEQPRAGSRYDAVID